MKKKPLSALSLLFGAVGAASCGKQVSTEASPVNGSGECGPGKSMHWSFRQPLASITRKSDLLLVVDTSSSMSGKRTRLASAIPSFLTSLPTDADLRVSVMLAHGGASRYSGKLYSASGTPLVLDSQLQSPSQMISDLQATLISPPADVDEANGEAPMYSVMKAIDPSHSAQIRAQGFFRSDAAFTVVMVSDENDICFPPELNGYSSFPDFVPSVPADYEQRAYRKYCISPPITPDSTEAALRTFQGDMPLKLGGIVHSDPARVPHSTEESIGHGILELVRKDLDGMILDIGETNYSNGLSQFGQAVSRNFEVRTRFRIAGSSAAVPSSVQARVDGSPVTSLFDASGESLQIPARQAGGPGSEIDVDACADQSIYPR